MKILITVSSYYPSKDGVSVVTQYLAEGLVKKGHKVTILTRSSNKTSSDDIHNGVVIKRAKIYTKYGFDFGDKKAYRVTVEEEANQSDVMINVCTQNAYTNAILKDLKKYKCKKVLYMHGMFDFKFRIVNFGSFLGTINKLWKELRWFFYYKVNRRYFKQYDLVIQLHEKDYGNEFFKRKFGIESVIIGNAVDDAFFDIEDPKGFKKPFDEYIVYVANYNDGKNQKLAISEFLKSNIDSRIGLVLIGSEKNTYYNSLREYIKKKRKKLGLNSTEKPILLMHGVDRQFIPNYIFNAYLSLMTSKWEVFPVSIAESIVSETPFISTDVGIVKYLSGGVVSKKRDIHRWIEELTKNPEVYDKLVVLCKKYGMDNFKIGDKVDMLEKKLKGLVEDKGSGAKTGEKYGR